MEIKAYIKDQVGLELREEAIKRFKSFRGSISNAIEEAVIQWLRRNERTEYRLKELIEKATLDPEVLAVFMFGSYIERKTDYRDIDLAFLIRDESDEVTVLSKYDDFDNDPNFDISCLNSLGTILRKEVLEGGIILLSKDKNALYDFAEETMREYSDFQKLYEMMISG
jgi:predicted nucleotidyltransferase